MKVDNITPKITFVEKGDFYGNTRLWGRHILYNTHELYLLGHKSSSTPIIGQISTKQPNLNLVDDITPSAYVYNKTPFVGSIEDIKPF